MHSMVEVLEPASEGFSTRQEAQSPLSVEPIAISYPSEMEQKPTIEESIPPKDEPSDWVREKYRELG